MSCTKAARTARDCTRGRHELLQRAEGTQALIASADGSLWISEALRPRLEAVPPG
jgi:hypothetical protein